MTSKKADTNKTMQKAEMLLEQAKSDEATKAQDAYLQSGYTADRDLANELLGGARMAQGMAKLANFASLSALAYVKEHKLYRAMAGRTAISPTGEKVGNLATFDGYLAALGLSRRTIDEQLLQRKRVGPAMYDALAGIGVQRKSFVQLSQLPDEEKDEVSQIFEVNDENADAIAAYIDDLATKHAEEKEALEKQNTDLKGSLEAAQDFAGKKNERINELEEELHNKSRMTPNEKAEELSKRLEVVTGTARGFLNSVETTIKEIIELDECPIDLRRACALSMERIRVRMVEIHIEYGIERMDVDDSWMAEVPTVSGDVVDYDAE